LHIHGHLAAEKLGFDRRRSMNGPLTALWRTFDRPPPLDEPRLLAYVNLLPAADQSNHDAPFRDALCELNEVLGLRFGGAVGVLRGNHVRIERPLRFVKDEHMLGWHEVGLVRIAFDVVLHSANECFATTASAS